MANCQISREYPPNIEDNSETKNSGWSLIYDSKLVDITVLCGGSKKSKYRTSYSYLHGVLNQLATEGLLVEFLWAMSSFLFQLPQEMFKQIPSGIWCKCDTWSKSGSGLSAHGNTREKASSTSYKNCNRLLPVGRSSKSVCSASAQDWSYAGSQLRTGTSYGARYSTAAYRWGRWGWSVFGATTNVEPATRDAVEPQTTLWTYCSPGDGFKRSILVPWEVLLMKWRLHYSTIGVPEQSQILCRNLSSAYCRRKFRSQTSDNMDRWKSRGGRVREEKKRS